MNRADLLWLQTLTALPTIAGHEDRVVRFVRTWVARRSDLRVKADAAGNLLISQKRRTRRPALLITAHMDHPGFLVTGSEGRDLSVEFRGGVRPGYFEAASLHLFPPGSDEPVPAQLVAYDPDSSTGRARARGVDLPVGSLGRWAFPKRSLGIRQGLLHAPGCDDLAGVAAALSLLDRARKNERMGHVGLLLTRAEEVGFVGAIAACQDGSIPPGARVVCLETSRSYAESPLGGGPVVRVGDRVSVFSPELTNRITAIAEAHASFPWQRKLMAGGACEATAFSAYGHASTCICLPLGNYHNMGNLDEVELGSGQPVPKPEVISLDDHSGLISLLMLVSASIDDGATSLQARLEARFSRAVIERSIPAS